MDREQHRLAEAFIKSLGLAPGTYDKKERDDGYELYATSSKRRRFGHVRLNLDGTMIAYAIRDFEDSENRFRAQASNHNITSYKFSPGDKQAWDYAVRVVLSAYNSKA